MIRNNTLALAMFATLTSVSIAASAALADKPAPAGGAAAAPTPASAAAPAPAPVDPAVRKAKMDALKKDEGTWACEGKVTRPEGEVTHAFTGVAKRTADGQWLQTSKEWTLPSPRRQDGFVGWDSTANTYKQVEVTSEGTMVMCTAPDVSGATITWMCDATFQGKPTQRRMTETLKSDKHVETVGEVKMPDGTWKKMVNSTCKKK